MESPTISLMPWTYNDGGRSKYYSGDEYDSITRSISIVTNKDYKEIHDLLEEYIKKEQLDERYVKNSTLKVKKDAAANLLKDMGYTWIPTLKFAEGVHVHLRPNELPNGRLVVNISKHFTAVIDNVINDIYKVDRNGTRAVYGYWIKKEEED